MTAAEYAGYVLMAGAALAAWVFIAIMLVGCLRAWLHKRDDRARGWLARRGYRLQGGVLWRMAHEDDEGWWTGHPLGKVRGHVAGRRLVERLQTRRLIDTKIPRDKGFEVIPQPDTVILPQDGPVAAISSNPAAMGEEEDAEPADPAEPVWPFDAEWQQECREGES